MKILQITNKFPYPPKDGGVIATFTMLKGFSLKGNDVTVASINTIKHFTNPKTLPHEVASLATFHDVTLNTNLNPWKAFVNLVFSKLPYTASRFIDKSFETCLLDILQSQTFDVIQFEGLYVLPYIPIVKKHSTALIVYRAHNVEFEIWDRLWQETTHFLKRIYLKNLAKRVRKFELSYLNRYDVIVPITNRDLDAYTDFGNTKPAFVAPTGVFANDLKPVVSYSRATSLFHIGGLDWAPNQQGLEWFIETCWPIIHKNNPQLIFRIAGRNAPDWFVAKIQVAGVEFVGEVANARDFMEENTIMIVPLLAGSGMRIKIIEGLGLGKAIVSTSIGAEGIPAIHNESICIANTKEEFVESIQLLIKNNEIRFSIEKNAVTFVHTNFDNETIISNLLDFYKTHGISN